MHKFPTAVSPQLSDEASKRAVENCCRTRDSLLAFSRFPDTTLYRSPRVRDWRVISGEVAVEIALVDRSILLHRRSYQTPNSHRVMSFGNTRILGTPIQPIHNRYIPY